MLCYTVTSVMSARLSMRQFIFLWIFLAALRISALVIPKGALDPVSINSTSPLPFDVVGVIGHKTGYELVHNMLVRLGAIYSIQEIIELKITAEWNDSWSDSSSRRIYHCTYFAAFRKFRHYFRDFRAFVVVRHPLDLIISTQRYHRVAGGEPWLHEPAKFLNGMTYQAYINSLSVPDANIFEMTCGPTVREMSREFPVFLADPYVTVVRMEDIKMHIDEVTDDMATHLHINSSNLLHAFHGLEYGNAAMKTHSANRDINTTFSAEYEFPHRLTNCEPYVHFERIFGVDILRLLPYADSISIFEKMKTVHCKVSFSKVYKPRNCKCRDPSGIHHGFSGCLYQDLASGFLE